MPYLATDKKGYEALHYSKPIRQSDGFGDEFWAHEYDWDAEKIYLPKGAIKALIGYSLKWEDEPVELTEELLKRD